jgi:hypothetical protein
MLRSFQGATYLLAVFGCVVLSACSESSRDTDFDVASDEVASDGAGGDMSGAPSAPPRPAAVEEAQALSRTTSAEVASPDQLPPSQVGAAGERADGSMIIRTGEVRIEVDSLEAGIAAVQRSATALGGWIAHSSLTLGERERHSARLEVKIPATRWDELLSGLRGIGELRQLTTATEDVGEQFVDLTAQLSNAERLEERYLQLLETRTGSLEDLLAVERELARVRERIEMLQGRLRYLSQRVAVSTLVVNLMEPMDLLAISPESEPIRDALRAAWRNFLAVITGGIALLGAALPLALLLAAAFWLWRRVRRRGQHVGDA